MRHVVLGCGISLDGYIARRDGAVDFLVMDPDLGGDMEAFMKTVDTAIMGRKTWEVSLQLGGPQESSRMTSYVYSRTQPAGPRQGVEFTSRPVRQLVEELRQQPGRDIWLMGGGELAREFLREDLVDKLYLGIVPVAIGDGLPLFPPGFPERSFRLEEHRVYPKTGTVTLTYARG